MEPQYIDRPAFTVVGMRYQGRNENGEIREMWERFKERVPEIQDRVGPAYGYSGWVEGAPAGEYEYIAGYEVRSVDALPEGMISRTFPAQRFAVFLSTDATLIPDSTRIYDEWLPASGYQTPPWMLEYYAPDYVFGVSPLDIWVPIL